MGIDTGFHHNGANVQLARIYLPRNAGQFVRCHPVTILLPITKLQTQKNRPLRRL